MTATTGAARRTRRLWPPRREAGVSEKTVATGLRRRFDRYVRYLEDTLANGHRVDVLPGIASLLAALETHNNLVLGLLTGNVEQGVCQAPPNELAPVLRVGAHGSDDQDRRRLPSIALRRVRSLHGARHQPRGPDDHRRHAAGRGLRAGVRRPRRGGGDGTAHHVGPCRLQAGRRLHKFRGRRGGASPADNAVTARWWERPDLDVSQEATMDQEARRK